MNKKTCKCSEEDWECDIGFERIKNGACFKIDRTEIDYEPPLECRDKFTVSQGYRKVAGDTCSGGVDHDPLELRCPG